GVRWTRWSWAAVWRRRMPRSVRMGGGPGSTTRELNFPGRRGRTGVVVASVQWRRSVEYERPIWSVLSAAVPSQYIQYLPSIFSGTMSPDLVQPLFQFPL